MNLVILFLILSSSLLIFACATIPQRQEECKALKDLHDLTDGKNWKHGWPVESIAIENCQTACDWIGIRCNADRTHIVEL